MSISSSIFRDLLESRIAQIHTSAICRIEAFNESTMRATIKPLRKIKTNTGEFIELPRIENVPVASLRAGGFVIKPPYKEGDVVLVIFVERAIDQIMQRGEVSEVIYQRKHDLTDAIIIGGLTTAASPLPEENAGDLVIATENFSAKIVIQPDGVINISGTQINLN